MSPPWLRRGRDMERRDGEHLSRGASPFQRIVHHRREIQGEPVRLFRTFARQFHRSGPRTRSSRWAREYGKPILDRVITPATSLSDAIKMCAWCRSTPPCAANLSVGMRSISPITSAIG